MNSHRSVLRAPFALAAACSFTFLYPSASIAQVTPFELQPVTVTGTGMPRTLGSEIAATSVLTRADIERAGARDLVSALNLLGSSLVEQQGGPGTVAVVRLRGADSRDTLILIDGVPLTDVTTGQASISQIPADWIDRVEVVRGNLSALYGANASGGVIQIFTRRARLDSLAAQGNVGIGSRGTRSLSTSFVGGNAGLSARLTLGMERGNGFSAANTAAANPDADGNIRHQAALVADTQLAPGQRISVDLHRITGKVEYDSALFGVPTDTHMAQSKQTSVKLHGEHSLASAWTLNWRAASTEENRSDTSITGSGEATFDNLLRNRVLALGGTGVLSNGWNLHFGLERLSQRTTNITYTRQFRDTDSVRLGSNYDASWGGLQANVRRDRSNDFGTANSALLGAKYELRRGLSTIAVASTSFTPPTLDFLFFDCSPFGFVCNNPTLRPEKSHNLELGLQWQAAHTLVRATAFRARYRDKIANDAFGVPQNVGRARNRGIELSARTSLNAWHFVAEASFQRPVDESNGQRLNRRARQQFAARLDHETPQWAAGASLRYVGSRPDGTTTLSSYAVVDASARWNLTKQWSLNASLENLLDRNYEPTAGYNGRPRSLFVGMNWQPQP